MMMMNDKVYNNKVNMLLEIIELFCSWSALLQAGGRHGPPPAEPPLL